MAHSCIDLNYSASNFLWTRPFMTFVICSSLFSSLFALSLRYALNCEYKHGPQQTTAKEKNARVAAKVRENNISTRKLIKSSRFHPCRHSLPLKFLHIDYTAKNHVPYPKTVTKSWKISKQILLFARKSWSR